MYKYPNSISLQEALLKDWTGDSQRTVIEQRKEPDITYIDIRGPQDTFEIVKLLIVQGRGNWEVIKFARELSKDVPERDHMAIIYTIFKKAQKYVRYQYDPVGLEFLMPANVLIKYRDLGFDCDDISATFIGAMLLSMGYNVQLIMGGKTRRGFTHIWIRVWLPKYKVWYPLDLTRKDKPPGWEMPHVIEKTYNFANGKAA